MRPLLLEDVGHIWICHFNGLGHYPSTCALRPKRSILIAAAAAPKPLSTFTTVTPGAQLASAAFSATAPPAATPYPTEVGTAITGASTRPPTTLNKAPSIPATAITTRQHDNSSRRSINRHRPATPTSAITVAA